MLRRGQRFTSFSPLCPVVKSIMLRDIRYHSVTNHSACRFGETPLRLRTARQDIRKIPEQRTNAERQRLAYVYRYVPKADISFSKCR